jgi:predicted Zn-dependent peptidase
VLAQPRIQAAEYDGQKNDLLLTLRLSESNTEERIRRAMLSALVAPNCPYYPTHPEQEIEAISSTKINDLQDFYLIHVSPAATTLVIAGDVKPSTVFAWLDDLTHSWASVAGVQANIQTTAPPPAPTTAPTNVPPKLIISNKQAFKSAILLPQDTQGLVIFGRIMPVTSTKQAQAAWVALQLADCVLSSHPIFSRLTAQFDAKPELLAETDDKPWSTKIFKLANNLVWSMQINLKPNNSSATAVNAIQNELEQFGQTGLTAEDLTEARKYLAGSIPVRECFNLDKLSHFVFHGFDELNEIDLLTRTQKIMAALSSNDINQFISNMFMPQNSSVVVAGPKQLIKQVHPVHEIAEPD